MTLPRAVEPFVGFADLLRRHGFAVSPDQTIDFIAGVGLLGPREIGDVRLAALALFSIQPERREEFDALFRAHFMDETLSAPATGEDGDEVAAHESGGETSVEFEEGEDEAGEEATAAERLSSRDLAEREDDAIARFARLAKARLPRRRSYRRRASRKGDQPDIRRAIRAAARRDGELTTLPRRRRKTRQRRILLLIDVSASMRAESDVALRFAHQLVQSAERAEVFTLGTRLTRITPALAPAGRPEALARAGALIADLGGGTRIGEALQTFLAVPRYAGFVRGAAVVVISDGLERGDPAAMIDAVRRLARASWTLDWLSPLAGGADFAPRTEALAAILPDLDRLAPGGGASAIVNHMLELGARR